MTEGFQIKKAETGTSVIHPGKFILWLFIVSIVMLFAALTSAYIVRQADGNWLEYELPWIFWITTMIIIVSSISMHFAYVTAKKNNLKAIKMGLAGTLVLGIAFLSGQYYSWSVLVDQDVYFTGNPAGSFLYVLTGTHGVHLISGLIFVLIVLIDSIKYKIHSKNLLRLELSMIYWHFLGVLWLYLFIFLKLNH